MELDLLQIARDLVRANTVSSRGTEGAVAVLKPLYEQLGWAVSLQQGPDATQQNLLARAPGPVAGEGLLLVTHLDTVDPGPRELWQTDPFQLTEQGDKLFGLGSADVKVDAACKLFAAARLAARGAQFNRPLAFLGTYQEEVGCKGAKHFTTAPLFPARYVMCGEPSELRLIDAHKGYAVAKITITDRKPLRLSGPFRKIHVVGKAAHSSTPHLGKSAILEGWQLLQEVGRVEAGSVANKVPADLHAWVEDLHASDDAKHELDDAWSLDEALEVAWELWDAWAVACEQSSPAPNARFSPAECVWNWGALRSEGPNLHLFFDARLLPGQKPEAVFGPFRAAAQKAGGERFSVEVVSDRDNEAMQLARPSLLLEAAQAAATGLGLNPEPQAKPTNTEAGVFARAGAEALVFGPGVSTNNAHCANEHTLLSQCRRAIDFYEALARRLCC